jgi:hypothetical protein
MAMSVSCGKRTILFIEIAPDQAFYRGEGMFLDGRRSDGGGVPAAAPRSDEPPFESQLG